MSAEPVRLERDGALAVVTFDSPPLNLMDRPLLDGLLRTVDALESEPARGVLFRAEGRAVSGGVDVSMFAAMDGPEAAQRTFDELIELARRVDRLPCPTVFAAHALCLTWAFELALACDLILAAESASFGLVERVIGLTPAMGGTQRLAERAGTGRAQQFVMEGRAFPAAELERWNAVNLVLARRRLRRCRPVLRGEAGRRADAGACRHQAGAARLPGGRGGARQRAGRGGRRPPVRHRGPAGRGAVVPD